MNSLIVDTSWGNLSLSLVTDGNIISNMSISLKNKMNEMLIGTLDYALKCVSYTVKQIDRFIAVTGPGSFTGIRIGVSTIQGISAGTGKPSFGISSLDAAALALGKSYAIFACRLRGKLFAFKEFDFEKNLFSNYMQKQENELPADTFLVNTSKNSGFVDLTKSIANKSFDNFLVECVPFYLIQSEAEIALDKKS